MNKMKKLIGGLCVAITLAIASYSFGPAIYNQATSDQGLLGGDSNSWTYWSWGQEDQTKAETLEIVWTDGCPPCRRLKVVAVRLVAEGYDVVLTHRTQDTHGSTRFPSLYYLDDKGGVIKSEIGFKTADHIKQYLRK